MATSIGTIFGDLILRSASFIAEFVRAAKATETNTAAMKKQMTGLQSSFDTAASTFKKFVGSIVTVQTARQLVSLGQAAIQMADDIGASATKIGVGVEELQRFRTAARLADVETGEFDAALKVFAKNFTQGKLDTAQTGITGALNEYIARIAEAPGFTEKARIAQEAFQKQWQIGLLLAQEGAGEFAKNAAEAATVSEALIKKGGDLDKTFIKVQDTIGKGFARGFLESFGKELNLTQQQLDALNKTAALFGSTVGTSFGEATEAIIHAGTVIHWFTGLAQNAANSIKGMFEGLVPDWAIRLSEIAGGVVSFNPFAKAAQGLKYIAGALQPTGAAGGIAGAAGAAAGLAPAPFPQPMRMGAPGDFPTPKPYPKPPPYPEPPTPPPYPEMPPWPDPPVPEPYPQPPAYPQPFPYPEPPAYPTPPPYPPWPPFPAMPGSALFDPGVAGNIQGFNNGLGTAGLGLNSFAQGLNTSATAMTGLVAGVQTTTGTLKELMASSASWGFGMKQTPSPWLTPDFLKSQREQAQAQEDAVKAINGQTKTLSSVQEKSAALMVRAQADYAAKLEKKTTEQEAAKAEKRRLEEEILNPPAMEGEFSGGKQLPGVHITLEGNSNLFTRDQVIALIEQMGEAIGDGARLSIS